MTRLSLLSFVLLAFAIAGCSPTRSIVEIDPGERFELGGDTGGAFRVELRNVGPGPVTVSARSADGTISEIGTLAPGESRQADLPAGTTALITNASGETARVAAVIRGGGTLGMGYVEVGGDDG